MSSRRLAAFFMLSNPIFWVWCLGLLIVEALKYVDRFLRIQDFFFVTFRLGRMNLTPYQIYNLQKWVKENDSKELNIWRRYLNNKAKNKLEKICQN